MGWIAEQNAKQQATAKLEYQTRDDWTEQKHPCKYYKTCDSCPFQTADPDESCSF